MIAAHGTRRMVLLAGVVLLAACVGAANADVIWSGGYKTAFQLTADNTTRLGAYCDSTSIRWNGRGGPDAPNPPGPSSAYEGAYRHFSEDGSELGTVSLDNVGDKLTLNFDCIFNSNPGKHMTSNISLFAVNSIDDTAPGTNPPANAAYRAAFSLGSSAATAGVQKLDWRDTTNPGEIDVPSSWAASERVNMQILLERTGENEMTITFSDVTFPDVPTVLGQFVDTGDILTTFNTVVFALRSSAWASADQPPAFRSISMEFVPEPATTALLVMGGLGVAWRRRTNR